MRMGAVTESAASSSIRHLGKHRRKPTLVAHDGKAPQPRLIHDHAAARDGDHAPRNRRVTSRIIRPAHGTGLKHVMTQQGVEQR